MSQVIHAKFKSTRWEETQITEDDASPKLTRASCSQEYSGGIVGESNLEYVMTYGESGRAVFVGMERIVGEVASRKGTFALQHEGVFENGVAKMSITVVEGSGTGDLASLSGSGSFESPHASEYEVALTLSFGA